MFASTSAGTPVGVSIVYIQSVAATSFRYASSSCKPCPCFPRRKSQLPTASVFGSLLSSCLQRLLAAKAVDVTTAAQLTSKKKAVRVAYSTAAELVAAAEALGVPLTLSQGARYCYSLPSMPATQHCQVRNWSAWRGVGVSQLACLLWPSAGASVSAGYLRLQSPCNPCA